MKPGGMFFFQILFMGSILLSVLQPLESLANVGDFLGFGARTMALGGAGVAGGTNGFDAYHNPASLSFESAQRTSERWSFSWGVAYVHPSFTPINNVVIQNVATDSLAQQSGSVDTNYKDTLGQNVGLSYRFMPEFYNLTVGLVSFLPINQIAYMDSGQPYMPEYFLYRARTQRPQFELGVGMQASPRVHLGLGVHTGFAVTGNATTLIAGTPGGAQAASTSNMTFASSLKPVYSFYLGALLILGDEQKKTWTVAAVYRQSAASTITVPFNATADIMQGAAGVPFAFNGSSTLFYDPQTIEVGGSWSTEWSRFVAQVDYQFWQGFQVPALSVSNQGTSATPVYSAGAPNYTFVNILVPRVGGEVRMTPTGTLRLGYSYRASVLQQISNNAGNYLDPPKHVITAGWGFELPSFPGTKIPFRLDLALNYQQLLTQTITKTANDELGNALSKIGSPGYQAGGALYGGGVSLAFVF